VDLDRTEVLRFEALFRDLRHRRPFREIVGAPIIRRCSSANSPSRSVASTRTGEFVHSARAELLRLLRRRGPADGGRCDPAGAAGGRSETVHALADVVLAQPVQGVTLSAATFPIYGDASRAGRELLAAERGLRDLGRDYDAACVALDAAGALQAAGDRVPPDAARARAASLLEPLACVNPY
jgi:hypothetical protein